MVPRRGRRCPPAARPLCPAVSSFTGPVTPRHSHPTVSVGAPGLAAGSPSPQNTARRHPPPRTALLPPLGPWSRPVPSWGPFTATARLHRDSGTTRLVSADLRSSYNSGSVPVWIWYGPSTAPVRKYSRVEWRAPESEAGGELAAGPGWAPEDSGWRAGMRAAPVGRLDGSLAGAARGGGVEASGGDGRGRG